MCGDASGGGGGDRFWWEESVGRGGERFSVFSFHICLVYIRSYNSLHFLILLLLLLSVILCVGFLYTFIYLCI